MWLPGVPMYVRMYVCTEEPDLFISFCFNSSWSSSCEWHVCCSCRDCGTVLLAQFGEAKEDWMEGTTDYGQCILVEGSCLNV